MRTSQETKQLVSALVKAQSTMKAPPKDKTANVPTKSGGKYSYSYADLATIIETVKKPLADSGLGITQTMDLEGDRPVLLTRLSHTSGEWLESLYRLSDNGHTPQERGSELTYARRYTLCAILGIAAEDDDDGEAATTAQKEHPQPSLKPPPPPTKNPGGMWGGKLTLIQEGKSGEVKFWTLVGENGDKLIIPNDGGQKNTTMHAFAENCCTRQVRVIIEFHLSAKKAMIVDAIKEEA